MPFHLKILIAIWVLCLGILGTAVAVYTKPQPAIHNPAFKVGDCYIRNGIREVWEPEADGKVIHKGITQYVLMGSAEAERRHGGDKAGFPQSIESFDNNHRKVLCPLSWKQKGITK